MSRKAGSRGAIERGKSNVSTGANAPHRGIRQIRPSLLERITWRRQQEIQGGPANRRDARESQSRRTRLVIEQRLGNIGPVTNGDKVYSFASRIRECPRAPRRLRERRSPRDCVSGDSTGTSAKKISSCLENRDNAPLLRDVS